MSAPIETHYYVATAFTAGPLYLAIGSFMALWPARWIATTYLALPKTRKRVALVGIPKRSLVLVRAIGGLFALGAYAMISIGIRNYKLIEQIKALGE
jgi:hypothetical protein